jgi:hypothetical protein
MASLYMQAFAQAHREGLIDRDVAIRLLRVWRARSILADADVSFGLVGCISEKLGVLPVEMEGEGDLAWEAPDHVRRMRLVEEAQRAATAGLKMKESELFQRLDDGVTPLCLIPIRPEGSFTLAANGRYEALVRKASDMVADSDVRKSITTLTLAAIVASEDRSIFLQNAVRTLNARSSERRVMIVKMFDRSVQRPRLFIFKHWQETLPDGTRVVVQRCEPAPPSRHLSDTPHAMRIAKTFRKFTPSAEVLKEEAATAAGAGVAAVGAAALDRGMVIKKEDEKHEERGEGRDGAAGGFLGVRSLACIYPLAASGPQGTEAEMGGSTLQMLLPPAAAAAAFDIFKPVDLKQVLAAPPPPCPGVHALNALSPSLSPSLSSSSSVASSSSSSSNSRSVSSFSSASSTRRVAAGKLKPAANIQPKPNAKSQTKKGTSSSAGNKDTSKTRRAMQVATPPRAAAAATTTTTRTAMEGSMMTSSASSIASIEDGSSAWASGEEEDGREDGKEALLLDEHFEGLEDLDLILNDAVMSELF